MNIHMDSFISYVSGFSNVHFLYGMFTVKYVLWIYENTIHVH